MSMFGRDSAGRPPFNEALRHARRERHQQQMAKSAKTFREMEAWVDQHFPGAEPREKYLSAICALMGLNGRQSVTKRRVEEHVAGMRPDWGSPDSNDVKEEL